MAHTKAILARYRCKIKSDVMVWAAGTAPYFSCMVKANLLIPETRRNSYIWIISKRVDDFARIQEAKGPRIRVNCLRITEI